ncbi:hypothetical protein LX32DRAFT_680828 [Colletotrichum zoysiae]|uniref:Uncharacterized protein n=1 Tax=Colletotrichum zoysiae TaxID=1216348 RepID=A0AAD9M7E1_9PEZI|nr:hypothetical protein LX32DRAFT_680828 [Colletotrichum zoysiae]
MPLVSDIQADLLEVLDRGGSFYELSLLLPDVGKDLAAAGMPVTPNATVAQLSVDHLNDHQSLELLHVAPRRLLVSMIQGTVAYDCAQDPSEAYSAHTDHPGIYVITVSVKDRGGKFLSRYELESVATSVEDYIEASEILERDGSLTAEEREKVDFAKSVDTAYGVPLIDNRARYVDGDSSVRNLREMADGLRRRVIQPHPGEGDARRHQTQAPQYVGCSTKLSRRLKDYDVATGLRSVNKPLSFLLHVLMASGYEPVITRRVVVKDGLNVAEGGGRPGIKNHRLQDAKQSVWAEEDALRTNLDLTLTDVTERKEFLGNIDKIDALRMEGQSHLRSIERSNARIERALDYQENAEPELEALARVLDRQLKEAVAERAIWKELDELTELVAKAILPQASVPLDEMGHQIIRDAGYAEQIATAVDAEPNHGTEGLGDADIYDHSPRRSSRRSRRRLRPTAAEGEGETRVSSPFVSSPPRSVNGQSGRGRRRRGQGPRRHVVDDDNNDAPPPYRQHAGLDENGRRGGRGGHRRQGRRNDGSDNGRGRDNTGRDYRPVQGRRDAGFNNRRGRDNTGRDYRPAQGRRNAGPNNRRGRDNTGRDYRPARGPGRNYAGRDDGPAQGRRDAGFNRRGRNNGDRDYRPTQGPGRNNGGRNDNRRGRNTAGRDYRPAQGQGRRDADHRPQTQGGRRGMTEDRRRPREQPREPGATIVFQLYVNCVQFSHQGQAPTMFGAPTGDNSRQQQQQHRHS